MSTNPQYLPNGPNPLHNMTAMYRNSLTSKAIEDALVTAGNIQRTKFMFHCWAPIPNRGIGGYRGGLIYAVLERMALIPLYSWQVPKIVDKTSGHISADVVMGSIRVGTVTTQRNQLADESEAFVKKAYGKLGVVTLNSLTCDDDAGRQEAFMLFQAAMKLSRADLPKEHADEIENFPAIRGVDVLMEDLVDRKEGPGFLSAGAPIALRYAVENGISVPWELRSPLFPDDVYTFRPGAFEKGMQMLREMTASAEFAAQLATGAGSGILVMSRSELKAASRGKQDAKMIEDPLDEFLSAQNPGFSWDTEVERSTRVTEGLIRAIEGKAGGAGIDADMMRLFIEQAQELATLRAERAAADKLGPAPSEAATGSKEPAAPSQVAASSGSATEPPVTTEEPPSTEKKEAGGPKPKRGEGK